MLSESDIKVIQGDSNKVLPSLEANSFDACITDPPYELTSITKRFGSESAAPCQEGTDGAFRRAAGGFMGKSWDASGVQRDPAFWQEVYRVLKPGAFLLAFGGSRSFHRMVSAIEDAGFEIRDTITWTYAVGFPKSKNISDELRRLIPSDSQCACDPRSKRTAPDYQGNYSSRLDPCDERPLPSSDSDQGGAPSLFDVHEHNHVDPLADDLALRQANISPGEDSDLPSSEDSARLQERLAADCLAFGNTPSGSPSSKSRDGSKVERKTDSRKPDTSSSVSDSVSFSCVPPGRVYPNLPYCVNCGKVIIAQGLGTALKPAVEFISVARKPLSESSVAANMARWGCGALNIDACRVPTGDKLSGGDANEISKPLPREGWLRPWMQDPEAVKHHALKVQANIAKSEALGRWPANFILSCACEDGRHNAQDCPVRLLDEQSGESVSVKETAPRRVKVRNDPTFHKSTIGTTHADSGGASRFFKSFIVDPGEFDPFIYIAKPSTAERQAGCESLPKKRAGILSETSGQHITRRDGGAPEPRGNAHPTVKPVALMQYLIQLVCRPGGHVLDPFGGSGTTGIAAWNVNCSATLIEMDPDYVSIARARRNASQGMFAIANDPEEPT